MRKEVVSYVDDLDGSEAAETVQFALDGNGYAIDLSTDHAKALRESFDEWIESARKLGKVAIGRRTVVAASRPTTAGGREQNQAIRDWARGQGLSVSARGRISAAIAAAYNQAH